MADEPARILQDSQDPNELVVAAVGLARSANPADHQVLTDALQSAVVLGRLDSAEEYGGPRKFLRLAAVLRELSENRAASARGVLISLAQSHVFLEFPSRVELLIETTAGMRPPPPALVAFWERHSGAEDIYVNMLVPVLVNNGSVPAMQLFEKKMAEAAIPEDKKVYWLRENIPPNRNQPTVLDSAERLLAGGIPESLRPNVVEVLFDFRREWYRPSSKAFRVPLEQFSTPARERLRRIGQSALQQVKLTPEQRKAVEDTLQAMDRSASRPGGS